MSPKKASIIIADGQYLIRFALKEVVKSEPTLDLIGEATSEEELLALVQNQNQPTIVIMDYFEDGFQLETIRKVKQKLPQTRIIIISADDNKKNILQSLEWGINSFLTKSCDEAEIKDAIKAALANDKYFCTRVLDYLLEKSFGKEEKPVSTPLTSREIEIVQLIAKGLVAKEIAALLNLSTHTIYTHRKKIMKKLELSSASELVMYALNQGLVTNE
jgi:DNA-binding NarL/FixJ family response regulator